MSNQLARERDFDWNRLYDRVLSRLDPAGGKWIVKDSGWKPFKGTLYTLRRCFYCQSMEEIDTEFRPWVYLYQEGFDHYTDQHIPGFFCIDQDACEERRITLDYQKAVR